ncbi:hypothetical protein O181_048727 [Austropuccinia psidii MF-1]|uniref:Major facilitator superfamily (MFS) profile domain-containing protein n=1 Tax=Austropuccinia psidii MF-1 TaxID=1389203 RepID=A0A9Q3E0E8_9BASI|nr:hypothetical protein [Austropuccinia psidii MF-1]
MRMTIAKSTCSLKPDPPSDPQIDVGEAWDQEGDSHLQVGVRKIRAISATLRHTDLACIYAFFSLLAWSLSLDQYTASTYIAQATATSFHSHSLLAAINTIKAVGQAVSQPPIAKLSNIWGRVETLLVCVVLYAFGYLLVALAPTIILYGVGITINILGITGLYLLQEIVIGDVSSLRNRLFWSIFPSIPGGINVWLGGNLAQSIIVNSTWRWGIGMFAIMTPILSIPIFATLWLAQHRLSKQFSQIKAPPFESTWQKLWAGLSEFDAIGIILLFVGSACVLVTVTIANTYGSSWGDVHCILLFVIGGLSTIGFFLWEIYAAQHPIMPLYLMTNRTVIVGMLLGIAHPMAGAMANDYFYTFLVVAGNQSVLSATRISGLAIFISIYTCLAAGAIVNRVRRVKWIIIVGSLCDVVGFALMVKYRSSDNTLFELVLPQLFRGLSEGLVGFPVQAVIQAMTAHQHLASITAFYLTIFYLSGGVGAAIGGSIWVNLIQDKLRQYIPDANLAEAAYKDPFTFANKYNISTPERLALAKAQTETQKTILIVATVVGAASLLLAFLLEDPEMGDERTKPEIEKLERRQYGHQKYRSYQLITQDSRKLYS